MFWARPQHFALSSLAHISLPTPPAQTHGTTSLLCCLVQTSRLIWFGVTGNGSLETGDYKSLIYFVRMGVMVEGGMEV